MNCSEARAIAFALIVGVLSAAAAQTPAGAKSPATARPGAVPQAPPANAPPPALPTEQRPPVVAQGDVAEGPDARHCLDLATNSEIIACAEKYRSHRPRK